MAYQKNTWVKGETIVSSDFMNNIENGIVGVDSDISLIMTELDKKYSQSNVPIENGTWTPVGYGSNAGTMALTYQSGGYARVGDIVTIWGAIEGTRNGATGEFRIGGVPFQARGTVVSCTIGYAQGINLGGTNFLGASIYAQNSYIRLSTNPLNSDSSGFAWLNIGATVNGTVPVKLSFSATYKIV